MMHAKRRVSDLLTEELPYELIIYDRQTHRVHCLNPLARAVWRHCDGYTSVNDLASAVHQELGIKPDHSEIRSTLRALAKRELLETAGESVPAISRRAAGGRLARFSLAGVGALVTTIAAPTVAQAATCVPANCPPVTNATASCVNNQCTYQCKPGFGNCDGTLINGCETNLLNDPTNCGGCGHNCFSLGKTGCSNGNCV
jgi:Coenzyme PQQ synthesis protein D (PqqD)